MQASPGRFTALAIWLLILALCAATILRTRFSTDLSAFLPSSPTPAQQALVEQLKDGVVSRLMLVGLRDAQPSDLARLNKAMAARMRQDTQFAAINNGEPHGLEADREFVFRHRYLLSDRVSAAHFEVPELRKSLEQSLELLTSEAGLMAKSLVAADPTGEVLYLVERMTGGTGPALQDDVWASRDRRYSLLLAQTRAPGFDIDAQARAIAQLRAAFEAAREQTGVRANIDLVGPGVFSVQTRDNIKQDAERFAITASLIVALMLWVVFRSLRLLVLGLLPVATGVAVGVSAVAWWHGEVHGITLGFGATLIGEAVDYAIYLFLQGGAKRADGGSAMQRLWPTLWLGVLTSVFGFSALFLSDFPGLAQLGLFSIAGLIAAVMVTRFVLPALLPPGFTVTGIEGTGAFIYRTLGRMTVLKPLLALLTGVCVALLITRGDSLWRDELGSLSPISMAAQNLDGQLRAELGAPDVRHLVAVNAPDAQTGLRLTETVVQRLEDARVRGVIGGFDTPSRYLPSQAAQRVRQAALPAPEILVTSLRAASADLPFEPQAFNVFVTDVAQTRSQPLLDRNALEGTRLALRYDSLIAQRPGRWFAMLPLSQVNDIPALHAALQPVLGADVVILDLMHETNALYRVYRQEAVWMSALGALAIVALLAASLRSVKRALVVCAPLAMAVVLNVSVLLWRHDYLTIFHLVGLLLVVAVGSNYALFFERGLNRDDQPERTSISLLTANLSTMFGFGLLGFSQIPVLAAIGTVVGVGALLSLLCAAALSPEFVVAPGKRSHG